MKEDKLPVTEQEYSRAQLLGSATLELPKDVLAAILKDGELYTKERARGLVKEFLTRKVR